jgi:thiamine kinase-like enzyme
MDLEAAARCVAATHRLGVPADHRLQVHAAAARSLLDEAAELAAPYLAWSDAPATSVVALRRAFELAEASADAVAPGAFELAIVNTDLNSHNFVVNDGRAWLLDWERARIAPAAQDLAHFLLPTTTLWRADSAKRLKPADEARFVTTYLAERPELDAEGFRRQLAALKAAVALRAVAWCAWALHATATGNRALSNQETLERCHMYLDAAFLRHLLDS